MSEREGVKVERFLGKLKHFRRALRMIKNMQKRRRFCIAHICPSLGD